MGFLSKLAGFGSKALALGGKIGNIITNPVGSIAQAAAAVAAAKSVKNQTVSSSPVENNVQSRSLVSGGGSSSSPSGGGISALWSKFVSWFMANKKMILIVAAVGVIGLVVYFFLFAKKGVRRKSPRRVNQAAKMRAARAAKRKK